MRLVALALLATRGLQATRGQTAISLGVGVKIITGNCPARGEAEGPERSTSPTSRPKRFLRALPSALQASGHSDR